MGEAGAGFAGVPGDVRRQEDALRVLGVQVRVVERERLLLVDVDADAGDAALVDGADEVGLDRDAAAAGVDHVGRRLHLAKALIINESGGALVVGGVDADDIGLSQQLVERDARVVLAMAGAGGGEIDDLHPEGRADGGDFLADGAHPHDPERLARDLGEGVPGVDVDAAGAVAAVAGVGIVMEREPGEREDVHPRSLRHGIRAVPRHVPDDDTPLRAEFRVDVIDAGPGLAHEPQLGAGVQEGLVDNDFVQQHHIGIRGAGAGLFGGRGRIADELAQRGDLRHRSVAHRGGVEENDFHTCTGCLYKVSRFFVFLLILTALGWTRNRHTTSLSSSSRNSSTPRCRWPRKPTTPSSPKACCPIP